MINPWEVFLFQSSTLLPRRERSKKNDHQVQGQGLILQHAYEVALSFYVDKAGCSHSFIRDSCLMFKWLAYNSRGCKGQ